MNFARRYPASLWVASLMIFGVALAIVLDALEWLPPPTSHFGYAGTTKILFFTLLCLAAGIGIVAMRQSRQLRDERIQTGRREEAIRARTRVLERIASGETLSEVLSSLVLTVEKEKPGMRCSVLLLDQEHLRHGAAPSLPDEYNRAIDGIKIGPEVGSCGAAAYLRRRVIVEDIAIHRNWIGFLKLTHQAGLRACWSEPIYSSTGSVLGTFAMYYGTPREPDESDLRCINDVAHLAAIAIERTNTQKAVRDSETRYKELFDLARDVILSADIHGKILTINPRVVELTGYTREELIGANVLDKLIMPEDHHVAEDVIKGLSDGQNQTYDIRWITKDGCIISLEGTSSSRRSRGGEFIATHCILRDVTERKQAEALQHAQHHVVELLHIDAPLEEVLSDLIRSIEKEVSGVAGSVSLLDEETRCLRFCAGPGLHEDCRRLIDGVEVGPKAPPCGITVFANQELVAEDIASDTRCAACADVATGHGLHACRPFPLRDQDGHAMGVFVAHFTTKIHPTEPMMKWITSAVQIAAIAIERWRAHRALFDRETQLQSLLGNINAIVWEADPKTWRFMYVSPGAEAVLGFPVERWLHEPGFGVGVIHPEDRERVVSLWREVSAEEEDRVFEHRAVTANGDTVWMRGSVRVFRDQHGRNMLRGLMVDITETRRVEEQLRDRSETLSAMLSDHGHRKRPR